MDVQHSSPPWLLWFVVSGVDGVVVVGVIRCCDSGGCCIQAPSDSGVQW